VQNALEKVQFEKEGAKKARNRAMAHKRENMVYNKATKANELNSRRKGR